jgi:spermidine synthase
MAKKAWYSEELTASVMVHLRMDRVLVQEETPHHDLLIFENDALGRVMTIDEGIQLTTRGEAIYHEFLAHVPLIAHGAPERVLIIGGGDGGTAREVLKHRGVKSVTQIDIDARVIEACKAHLPSLNAGAFDDPRFALRIGDGAAVISELAGQVDVLIIDAADPDDGASETLFTPEFFLSCRRALRPGGVLVSQGGCPAFEPYMARGMIARLAAAFGQTVGIFSQTTPDFFCGAHAFTWAGNGVDISALDMPTLQARAAAAALETLHYCAEAHFGSFLLTKAMRKLVDEGKRGIGADVVSLVEGGTFDAAKRDADAADLRQA